MLPPERAQSEFAKPKKPIEVLKPELERLKVLVPEVEQVDLPTWLINEFFGDGAAGTAKGFMAFHEAVAYLGRDARGMDVKDTHITNGLVTQVRKFHKVLGETLRLMNGPSLPLVNLLNVYQMHQAHKNGGDRLAIARELNAKELHIVELQDFASKWLKRQQRTRGRRKMAPLTALVGYVLQLYSSIHGEAEVVVYPVGNKQDVTLNGKAGEFVETCVEMVNVWAKHLGHTQIYTRRNIVSAVQAYQKQQRASS